MNVYILCLNNVNYYNYIGTLLDFVTIHFLTTYILVIFRFEYCEEKKSDSDGYTFKNVVDTRRPYQ